MSRVTEHLTPPAAPNPQPVDSVDWLVEWRFWLELSRLALAMPLLARLPKGSAPVILIPGWKAPELSMDPLRLYLKSRGYDARHWGIGTNQGYPIRDSQKLAGILSHFWQRGQRRFALVGWSLGGVIARETARQIPECISGVVTYGTPVVGGPSYTLVASAWSKEQCRWMARRIEELDRRSPIVVPIAAIFSRSDEVVDWAACIDRVSPNVRHFEVESPHIAMGFDPAVWSTVARQLHAFTRKA